MPLSGRRVTADFRRLSIGPVRVGDHTILLRPAVFGDAQHWRTLRMRDRDLIEPFWIIAAQDWESRHSQNAWIREVLEARHSARTRQALPMVVEVDGRFGGQCNLTAIDLAAGEAELGIWMDVEVAGHGVSVLAAGLLVDYAFTQLGLLRIIAPVASSNVRARHALRAACFRREATLPAFVSTGSGDEIDHELWTLEPDRLPEGGLSTLARRRIDDTATLVAAADHSSIGPRGYGIVLLRNVSGVRSILRYHLGSVMRLRRRLSRVRVPDSAATPSDPDSGIELHRLRIRDTVAGAIRPVATPVVVKPVRPGSWFSASSPGIAFHIMSHDEVIGRAELVGLNTLHHIAEATVRVDRDRTDADTAGVALRLLVDFGLSVLMLRRISAATDPDDEFGAMVASSAGLQREGTLGGIEMWATRTGELRVSGTRN